MSKYNVNLGVDPSKPTELGTPIVREPLKEGKAIIRLVQYVEFGIQPQKPYLENGKSVPKKDAPTCQLVFEVVSKRHLETYEQDGENKTSARYIALKEMAISSHPKSTYVKTFNILNYEHNFNKFFQMVATEDNHKSGLFTCELVNKEYNGKVYTNVTNIKPPRMDEVDPETGEPTGRTLPISAHPQINPTKIFLWDQPFKEDWDALYIEKNNFLQEKILNAKNFQGSAIQALLNGISDETQTGEETQEVAQEDELAGII